MVGEGEPVSSRESLLRWARRKEGSLIHRYYIHTYIHTYYHYDTSLKKFMVLRQLSIAKKNGINEEYLSAYIPESNMYAMTPRDQVSQRWS